MSLCFSSGRHFSTAVHTCVYTHTDTYTGFFQRVQEQLPYGEALLLISTLVIYIPQLTDASLNLMRLYPHFKDQESKVWSW